MSEVKTYKPTHDMKPGSPFDSMPNYVSMDDYQKLESEMDEANSRLSAYRESGPVQAKEMRKLRAEKMSTKNYTNAGSRSVMTCNFN